MLAVHMVLPPANSCGTMHCTAAAKIRAAVIATVGVSFTLCWSLSPLRAVVNMS